MSTATQATETAAAEDRTDLVDAAVRETEARLMASPELLQMRMENESIMTECRLRPRNIAAMKRELQELLSEFPELAGDAIYAKPVGEVDGKQKIARGLSIRAAETLAEVYGYNRVQSSVTMIDSSTVKVEATFIDYQKGRVWQDGGPLSMYYTASRYKGGGRVKHKEDRFFGVVVKAEASRRVREVITRSVNASLKAWFMNQCKKRQADLLTDEKVQEIIAAFKGKGATLEQLDTLVGRPYTMGWTNDDKALLMNVWNAIKDGEITIDQVIVERESAADSLADLTDELTAKTADAPPTELDPEPTAEPPVEPEPAPEVDQQEESTKLCAALVTRAKKAKTIDRAVIRIETEAEDRKGDGGLYTDDYDTVMDACLTRRTELAAAE